MKIYVASSWKNEYQQNIVKILRAHGHEVYDFQNPPHGLGGFAWSELDPEWETWTREKFREKLLNHPIAAFGFMSDFRAMRWAEAIVMVLPCGNSAHMELGFGTGAGKRTIVYMPADKDFKPDLMYLQADHICITIVEVLDSLKDNK